MPGSSENRLPPSAIKLTASSFSDTESVSSKSTRSISLAFLSCVSPEIEKIDNRDIQFVSYEKDLFDRRQQCPKGKKNVETSTSIASDALALSKARKTAQKLIRSEEVSSRAPSMISSSAFIELSKYDINPACCDYQEMRNVDVLGSVNISKSVPLPKGRRWAICAPNVNISGCWKIIIDSNFQAQYDTYLAGLGINYFLRAVALQVIGKTTEKIQQSCEGRKLRIIASNPKGVWDRTLVASGSDYEHEIGQEYIHDLIPLKSADKEEVEAEAWWEDEGTVHRSFIRGGGRRFGGGDFESKRYLLEDKYYICESIFHPNSSSKKSVSVTWKFARQRKD